MLQHSHESTPFSEEKKNIIVVCDALQSPANIGAIFRLCDAFGVSKLVSNTPIDLSSNRLLRTSRSTEKVTPYSVVDDITVYIEQLQQQGYMVIALEISAKSISLQSLPVVPNQKMVLIIGNEKHGVSEALLQQSNVITHIEMYGKNSSMNVAQATAIALYELTKD